MNSQQLASFMIPGGNYGYTGAAVETLTSFENTLALTLFDESGSTRAFARQMELAVKQIVRFLRRSPRADNLLYTHYHFDRSLKEILGWTPLQQVVEDQFDGCWAGGGSTNLFYSEEKVLDIMLDYAKRQAQRRYICNGILCTMTDGEDYTIPTDIGYGKKESDVELAFGRVITSEDLESMVAIMIGINPDTGVQSRLEAHAMKVGYTRYLPVEKADEKTLARIADFISQSIQSQSQALKSGGPSQKIASLKF